MAVRVVCLATRLREASARHRAAEAFLAALRGEEILGAVDVPVGGTARRLDASNRNDSIDWFGEMAAGPLARLGVRPPVSLVPVPSARATVESSSGTWTSLLAISLLPVLGEGAELRDVLRWKEDWSARAPDLGALPAAELYANLVVVGAEPFDRPVVLVDYILTTGSPIRAAAARLRKEGARVALALCAGRIVSAAGHEPFAAVSGELADFEP